MKKSIFILFPHQLFEKINHLSKFDEVYLVEELLFFNQYNFHKSKLIFHRASMKFYEHYLTSKGINVTYIEARDQISDVRKLIPYLSASSVGKVNIYEVSDFFLNKRIELYCNRYKIALQKENSPYFINSDEELSSFFKTKKRFYQTDFYIHQRKSRNILLDLDNNPLGGKWTFDTENRLKYPKGKQAPALNYKKENEWDKEALSYVITNFKKAPGSNKICFPSTFDEAEKWFDEFLKFRFLEFGEYEDALVSEENLLHHSLLSPLINVGLLTPKGVIEKLISFGMKNKIPLNSLEGIVRQILGWREFIKAVYLLKGVEERTKNFWNHHRKIPASFYNGTTGIFPVDNVIKKVLDTGYCHHIERLMVLGNFMLLCEFHPDEVYRWFMELFIDAYDWVMVPNVYGMSQFADGGIMATKPYISGSNYLMKMSNYPKGPWQQTWDGLFWNFMDKNRIYMSKNPRLGMLVKSFDKMDDNKRDAHLSNAASFFNQLDKTK